MCLTTNGNQDWNHVRIGGLAICKAFFDPAINLERQVHRILYAEDIKAKLPNLTLQEKLLKNDGLYLDP